MTNLIAIDWETHPISEQYPSPKPVCLSYATENEAKVLVGEDIEPFLKNVLALKDTLIIAHNMKFEMMVTHEWFPELREAIFEAYSEKRLVCTMVNEKVINNFENKHPQFKFDLATLVKKYLKKDISAGKKDPDAWRLRYNELENIPLEQWPADAVEYSIQDSVYALEIFKAQLKHYDGLSYASTRADFVLGLMANKGILVDKDRINILHEELLSKLKPNYDMLEAEGFGYTCKVTGKFKKNMNKFRAFIEENVDSPDKTAKGAIKVTNEALSHYIPKEGADVLFKKVLLAFTEMSEYEKILSAFIPSLTKAANQGGLIRTNYNPVVSTGRTSSSGSSLYPSLNVQQLPRGLKDVTYDVRNCFKAREGFKLVSIDYGGLELCATAHQLNVVFGHSRMKDLLNEGSVPVDLHSKFAAEVMSIEKKQPISYEEFLSRKSEAEFALYRQICKALNLGFPGGIGYEVMGTQLFKEGIEIARQTLKDKDGKTIVAISEKQAVYFLSIGRKKEPNLRVKRVGKRAWIFIRDELVGLKQRYFDMYPEIHTFLTEKHNDYLTGEVKMQKNDFDEWEPEPLYKFESCGMQRNYAMYTQFCNGFLMQSPSAQGAKEMLWDIGLEFRNSTEVTPLAFIHDECVFEVAKNENMEYNIGKCAELMIDAMGKILPSVRINVEASAMDYWCKKTPKGEFEALYWKNMGDNTLQRQKKIW